MDSNEIPKRIQPAIELATVVINAALAVAFYGAEENLHGSGFPKNNLTGLSEGAFYLGATVVLIALLSGRRLLNPYYRLLLIGAGTAFSQAGLIGLLASAIPFKMGNF